MTNLQQSPPESLIKFNAPLFVAKDGELPETMTLPNKSAVKKGGVAQMEDIVNSILPPRAWSDTQGNWMQTTSTAPATRLDVIELQDFMDLQLVERQGRDSGICPVREDIYAQCLDELIRQVTLNGPERGLLLLRIRDEIHMTIDAYKILYDSSVTFGVTKQLQAEDGMGTLVETRDILALKKQDLETQLRAMQCQVEVFEKQATESRAVSDKKKKEELDFQKTQGQHLDSFLKSISSSST